MEHNATATYVADADPRRSRTYPFREGQHIPRSINVNGMTFTLRAVCYDAPAVERDEIAQHVDTADEAIRTAREALDRVQSAKRAWNARLYAGVVSDLIANDTAVAGDAEAA